MPNIQLYIEDELVDLFGDEQIATDYEIADFGRLETRQGFRSINFDIPKTANNKRIIENAQLVNANTNKPYRRLKARLLVSGIDQKIRFTNIESIGEKINIRLFGGNANFFESIKGELSELDLNEFDHHWTLDNVVDSRFNNDGYIYPIIDYFSNSPNDVMTEQGNTFNVRYALPALFLQSVIEKIVNEAGYQLDDRTDDLPIVMAGVDLSKRNTDGRRYLAEFLVTPTPPFDDVPTGIAVAISPFFPIQQFAQYFDVGSNNPFIFVDEVEIEVEYNFLIINNGVSSQITFSTTDSERDNPLPVINQITQVQLNPGVNVISGTYTREVRFDPNGNSSSLIVVTNANGNLKFDPSTSLKITKAEILEVSSMKFNTYITVNTLFGKIKQSDILKYYLEKSFSLIQVNDDTKVVSIVPFNLIGKNAPKAIDWSDKVDETETTEIEFAFKDFAQNNELNYKEDDSVEAVNIQGANGVIRIDNENLPLSKVLFTSIFSASEMVLRFVGIFMPQIKLFEQTSSNPIEVELNGKANARVLFISKNPSPPGFNYTDGQQIIITGDIIPQTWFMTLGVEGNLGFANNLIEENYQGLQLILNKTKIIKERIRLKAVDINRLDFFIPIYIQKHNAYFYINRISGYSYTDNESTEVELIKLK